MANKGSDHVYARPEATETKTATRERAYVAPIAATRPSRSYPWMVRRAAQRLEVRGPFRPATFLSYYREYRKRVERSEEELWELKFHCLREEKIKEYTEKNDGRDILLSWPINKKICVMSFQRFNYMSIANQIAMRYSRQIRWAIPIGVVASTNGTPYSEYDLPVLVVDDKERVFLYVKRMPWLPSDEPPARKTGVPNDVSLYLAARSVTVLITEGLSHCDWCYSEEGGAPYGTTPDAALYALVSAKKSRPRLVWLKRRYGGHVWNITDMPGADGDRYFHLENGDTPPSIAAYLKNVYGTEFTVLGYVTNWENDEANCSNVFILINDNCEVFTYLRAELSVVWLAKNVDAFFRMGTRRMYYNFELGKDNPWAVPTTKLEVDPRLLYSDF